MKDGGWIPIDKRLVFMLPKNREYTFLEAYISLRYDMESDNLNSVNGYSRMWSWSRNKVRNFIEGLRTGKGHVVDNQRTGKGQEIRLFFKDLSCAKDSQGTVKGQSKDNQGTTTINKEEKEKKETNILPVEKITECFEWAWKKYPSAGDKAKSLAAFKKTVKTSDDFHKWRSALATYMDQVDDQRNSGFSELKYKNADTFFRNWQGYVPDNWADWIPRRDTDGEKTTV